MSELIDRLAFIERERKLYCDDCDRRKGMKNGKLTVCYEIGDAPCRSCWLDDALTDLDDAPAIDAVPVVHGEWVEREVIQDRRDARIPEWQQARCSVCGKWHTTPYMYCFDDYDYCPNCGALMGERREG